MTAPDLLDAIVARYPGELVLAEKPGGWSLVIECPALGMNVGAHAVERGRLTAYAQHWERFRLAFLHGPQRCRCGALYSQHGWDERSARRRGACPAGGLYEPQELAGLPAEGNQR